MTLLTPAQYAKRHNVSTIWVQKLCQAGRIHSAIRLGRSWGIPEDAPLVTRPPGRPAKTEQPA